MATPEATLARQLAGPLSRRARRMLSGYAYLVPALICLGGTVAFPIVKAAHMSLYNNVLIRPQDYAFIGLGTNQESLRQGQEFFASGKRIQPKLR